MLALWPLTAGLNHKEAQKIYGRVGRIFLLFYLLFMIQRPVKPVFHLINVPSIH
jgi:hypothetical protein